MTKYLDNFDKYRNLAALEYESFEDLIKRINKSLVPLYKKRGIAIILVGYSGNGKSTLANYLSACDSNAVIVSMDESQREILKRYGYMDPETEKEMLDLFGKKIEEAQGKNLIIDGNFLNLFTRSALSDTLHELSFFVKMIDLREIYELTEPKRIMSYASKDLGVKIDESNVVKYKDNPKYNKRKEDIQSYHEKERQSAFVDLQDEYCAWEIGMDEVFQYKKDGSIVKNTTVKKTR